MSKELHLRDSVTDPVLRGIAKILWASAWADATEERGESVCGEITSQMPAIPNLVYVEAAKIYGRVEQICGTMPHITHRAAKAAFDADGGDADLVEARDGVSAQLTADKAERFGECIAYRYIGAGVDWTDDQPDFDVRSSFDGAHEKLMWDDIHLNGETPCEVRDLAEAWVRKHYPLTFPSIAEVCVELAELAGVRDGIPSVDEEPEEHSVDVRLCVEHNGDWCMRFGDVGHDPYHSPYVGAASVSKADTNRDLRIVAVDLIKQARDAYNGI